VNVVAPMVATPGERGSDAERPPSSNFARLARGASGGREAPKPGGLTHHTYFPNTPLLLRKASVGRGGLCGGGYCSALWAMDQPRPNGWLKVEARLMAPINSVYCIADMPKLTLAREVTSL
jgi:hypothetical protein